MQQTENAVTYVLAIVVIVALAILGAPPRKLKELDALQTETQET